MTAKMKETKTTASKIDRWVVHNTLEMTFLVSVLARLKGLTYTSNKQDPPPLKNPDPSNKEKHITLLQLVRQHASA